MLIYTPGDREQTNTIRSRCEPALPPPLCSFLISGRGVQTSIRWRAIVLLTSTKYLSFNLQYTLPSHSTVLEARLTITAEYLTKTTDGSNFDLAKNSQRARHSTVVACRSFTALQVGPMNGREARESGLWLKAWVALIVGTRQASQSSAGAIGS